MNALLLTKDMGRFLLAGARVHSGAHVFVLHYPKIKREEFYYIGRIESVVGDCLESVLACVHYALGGRLRLVGDRVCSLRHGGIRSSGRE